MGSQRRGRDKLVNCESCGRSVPRNKAVDFEKRNFFSTDLRGQENVSTMSSRLTYYCISCGKHRKIFEKKKKLAQRQSGRNSGVF